jgi:hypothetical protein
MRQVRPDDYAHDDEGEPAEEYIADAFRWMDSPELLERDNLLQRKKYATMRAFLEAFAETGNIRLSCGAAKITRTTFYRWRDEVGDVGDAFRAAFKQAEAQAVETLEAEARRRAVHGTRKIRKNYDKDGNLRSEYVEIDYSDTLLIFLLKGAAPDKYADRSKVDVKVTVRQEVEKLVAAGLLDPSEADAAIAEAEAIVRGKA